MRHYFYVISIILVVLIEIVAIIWPPIHWSYIIILPLLLLGLYDILQTKHTILRNFPVIGHFRYMFEAIRPEIHQYLVESDQDGCPFNRELRSIVYQRSKNTLDTMPYGTRKDVNQICYEWLNHSMAAKHAPSQEPRILIGGDCCRQPYAASLLNISAMSFGALSQHAIMALNQGAKMGGFYHNTGEGGLSQYHLQGGGDLVWQLGTACFGARTKDGKFCPTMFAEKACHDHVKMIEIKISQGAKPGHGGILPAAKLTEEIAAIRNVHMGHDVESPPGHLGFSTPNELIAFITQLRELSHGKPVGFKLCVGHKHEFFAICKAMLKHKVYPDFITVDGAEGGTGAAPMEFSNAVGSPLAEGLRFVHNTLEGLNLRKKIRIICSGRMITGFNIVAKLATGADLCNSARGMMMALGCIQSLQCNKNNCPTGVATQDRSLMRGLVVAEKNKRVYHFHRNTIKSVLELVAAAGLDSPSDLRPRHIYRRINANETKPLHKIYRFLQPGELLDETAEPYYHSSWEHASPDHF